MKFLCLECDEVMGFQERQLPGDGTLAAVFSCGSCGREMAMLTNPMETQFVSSMGVKIGGSEVPTQPMEVIRTSLEGGSDEAFVESESRGRDNARAGNAAAQTARDSAQPESAPAETGHDAAVEAPADTHRSHPPPVEWSPDAVERLGRVPGFVRGMVKRIYTDYARERGIRTITPEIMDTARTELGLEGM